MSIAIVGGEIRTGTGARLGAGTALIEHGRFTAVGRHVQVPADATVVDARGMVLTPGLIEAHCHAGLAEDGFYEDADYNELTQPLTPHVNAVDAFRPDDSALLDAARMGVTVCCALPGSANVFCGTGCVLRTWARRHGDYIIDPACGMKVALGENPKRVHGGKDRMPATRMGTAALLRTTLIRARDYAGKLAAGERPDYDPVLDALRPVLAGTMPLRCHAHRAADMVTFIRLIEEFALRFVFEHATECDAILNELAAAGAPLVIGPSLGRRSKRELHRRSFASVAAAVAAGLEVAITTDHSVTPLEHLRLLAALAIAEGLDEDAALRAISIVPARILGIDADHGSIATGKQADCVLWPGDPFDIRVKPAAVYIAGERIPSGDGGDHERS